MALVIEPVRSPLTCTLNLNLTVTLTPRSQEPPLHSF